MTDPIYNSILPRWNRPSGRAFHAKRYLILMLFVLATSCGILDNNDDNGGSESRQRGYSWDHTHVNTQWLFEADENDNLTVEKVTNLNPSGAGSLSAALLASQNNDNTLIVFEVGGVLDNDGTTYIRSRGNNVYIAGQTAPWPGITVIRGGMRIHGDRTIVQHLSLLPGDEVDSPDKGRAVVLDAETQDNIFDHCTAAWSPDTNLNFRQNATRQAFINGINAEALNVSSHSEGNSPRDGHGYGTLHRHNNSLATVLGVLNMHNWKRNPAIRSTESSMSWISVYSYNWGAKHYHGWSGETPELDWIGNVMEDGPDTHDNQAVFDDDSPAVYYSDNILRGDRPMEETNNQINFSGNPMNLSPQLNESDIVPAEDLEDFLVDVAGPRPADRAPLEQRLMDDFINREGSIINSFDDHPVYPDYETTTRELDPPDTEILDWLQHYTDEVEMGVENPLH